MEAESSRKKHSTALKEQLKNELISKMTELGLWKEELLIEIPTYWDTFSNFVIFSSKFFTNNCWVKAESEIWKCVSKVFSGKSIALQGNIQNNDFRSPNTRLVHGDSPWVEYIDNGIKYKWNVEHTMFCTGNVSERHRIANLDCEDKVVVDMFAGIGYFSLPYLVHARAKKVIACEWNPLSVEALRMNLSKNKIPDAKCIVLEGDVRSICPRRVADHINLGLIPSCEQYWSTAADILKPSGGVLHVHENVTSFSKVQDLVIQCNKCLYLLQELSINISDPSQKTCDFNVFTLNKENVGVNPNRCGLIKWKKIEWFIWGIHVSHCFCELLSSVTNTKWTVTPTFLHRVKAYAPHIDHLVIDLLGQNMSASI